jgi:hypothetical protein
MTLPPLKWFLIALEAIGAVAVTIVTSDSEEKSTVKDVLAREATSFAGMLAVTAMSTLSGLGDQTEVSNPTKFSKKPTKVVILG